MAENHVFLIIWLLLLRDWTVVFARVLVALCGDVGVAVLCDRAILCPTPLLVPFMVRQRKKHPKQEAAMAKKSSTPKTAAKKSNRKPKRSWSTYVSRSLKAIDKKLTISGKTMKIVNSFIADVFERVAGEAATLVRVNKKRTLGSREIQTAVRLVLPVELAKHAMAEGTKAVAKASA